jgi:hypothetical protein
MSDELDRELLRRFAVAHEPLPDTDFHARVMTELRRSRGWRGLPRFVAAALRAVGTGFAAGIGAPFRLRLGRAGFAAIILGAILGALSLLGA